MEGYGSQEKDHLYSVDVSWFFRIGAHVPVPGINHSVLQDVLQGNLFGIFDVIFGWCFPAPFPSFAMSITPLY